MSEKDWSDTNQWLLDGEYLPEMLRDFHDQKDLFKVMHHHYEKPENEGHDGKPCWRDGQIYTIDWFLWYMASRGYTLQKSRKNLIFREFENWSDLNTASLADVLASKVTKP